MKTIAVEIEDDLYTKAQRKASALESSVPQVITDYLRVWAADASAIEDARRKMIALFSQPNWQFTLGAADDRNLRNARR